MINFLGASVNVNVNV